MCGDNIIEIKKSVWNGSINLKIVLSLNGQDIEYLTKGYRNSYFPLIYPKLKAYFQLYIRDEIVNPIWLEYEGSPIKWNLPIGVLYDYLHLPARLQNKQNSSSSSNSSGSGSGSRYWKLDMKIGSQYPSDYIIPFTYKSQDGLSIDYSRSLVEILKNSLKQSSFVINGTAKPIMQLSEQNSEQLWNSILTRNLYDYTLLIKKTIKSIHCLPVKMFLPDGNTVVQVPVAPNQILADFLEQHIANLLDISRPYIQGIDATPLLQVQFEEIWHLFKHLDNVLYINIIML